MPYKSGAGRLMVYPCKRWLRSILAGMIVTVGALAQAQAGPIGGVTTAKPVSADPINPHPQSRDDKDVTTPVDITFLSSSSIVTTAAKDFATFNFVFAGAASGVGKNFTPIDPSDFNIE